MTNLPRPGLHTFIVHVRHGLRQRYGVGYTLRRSWQLRHWPLLSIEPVTQADIEYVAAHRSEWMRDLGEDA